MDSLLGKSVSSMDMTAVTEALTPVAISMQVEVFSGYPDSGAQLPYITHRPMITLPGELAVAGNAIGWSDNHGVYCSGASVEASHNLARAVLTALDGARVGDYVVTPSIGYIGARVEGAYETEITLQANQGAL